MFERSRSSSTTKMQGRSAPMASTASWSHLIKRRAPKQRDFGPGLSASVIFPRRRSTRRSCRLVQGEEERRPGGWVALRPGPR